MKQHPFKIASLGMQHMLAMYAGAIIVPLIVGGGLGLNQKELTYLVSIDLLMCGVATILQALSNRFFGIGLPVVLGCTFTAVGPMIAIGKQYGVSSIYGAIIAAG
ncbi:solute carrier family 23 protein, partial [Vibrio parahaemolyticus]|nr:solute carrier family 23 protein [Vibrio parahaemolyticus]